MSAIRCSRNNCSWSWVLVLAGALGLALLAGCIADTAEDSDLPWSSNKNWEGMGPLPSMMLDRYD